MTASPGYVSRHSRRATPARRCRGVVVQRRRQGDRRARQRPGRPVPLGIRLLRRPTQCGQINPDQCVGRSEDRHRVIEAADDEARRARHRTTRPMPSSCIIDTPGLHKPRTLLGERLNDVVRATWSEVDVVGVCLPANQRIGPGDRYLVGELAALPKTPQLVAIATKSDLVPSRANG